MNILLIEDNIDHLELISEILFGAYKNAIRLQSFSTLRDGLEYLNGHAVDLLLCDLKLPDSDISETVASLKNLNDAPAIIVLTSLNDETLAHQLVKEGIQDYLLKSELSESQLVRACNYAIERKNLNLSLINRNEDYKAFCYSLTHDFKSSLWQIARFAQIFRAEAIKFYPDDNKLPFDFLDKIFDKVEKIQQLVNDLQEYLTLDVTTSNFNELNLLTPIQNALDTLSETIDRNKAEITIAPMPTLFGSTSQLQLLFTNLISNALKYNDKDTITIRISAENSNNHFHIVRVCDNGIGIPQKDLGKIFIPFERVHSNSKKPGSGLGLSIVKRVLQHHQGRVHVESEVGSGTTFTLFLPKTYPSQ